MEIIFDPGFILLITTSTNVFRVLFITGSRKHLRVCLSVPPKTYTGSPIRPLLEVCLQNRDSFILTLIVRSSPSILPIIFELNKHFSATTSLKYSHHAETESVPIPGYLTIVFCGQISAKK